MNKELTFRPIPKTGPAYLHIADLLRNSIREGILEPGEAIPSLRVIAEKIGTHRHTVMSALHELVSEGWLESHERKGYRVTTELPSSFFLTKRAPKPPIVKKTAALKIARTVSQEEVWSKAVPECKYNFRSGLGDLRLFPVDEFRTHLNDGLKRNPTRLLSYGDPIGHPALLVELEKYLRRVRGITGRKLVVTHGSQEGIFILAQILLNPGDGVAVERLGYPPAWDAFRCAGAQLVPVKIDAKGILPDSFEQAVKSKKIRLLYTTPLHQYPTTVTMPMERRVKIYEIARKYDCLILEDDYDHEFHYRSNPLPPMAAEDPDGRILYVSTLSKILFPSARIGFMAVPEALLSTVSNFKKMMSRQNETILQEAVARWMSEGGFERHLRKMRRTYHERRDVMVSVVEEVMRKDKSIDFQAPDGGMAVWVGGKKKSGPVSETLLKKGLFAPPESFYTMDKEEGTHFRLGFANQTPAEIKAGMEIFLKSL